MIRKSQHLTELRWLRHELADYFLVEECECECECGRPTTPDKYEILEALEQYEQKIYELLHAEFTKPPAIAQPHDAVHRGRKKLARRKNEKTT